MEVELIEATKKFGSLRALDQVSLKIPSGEIIAVLGSNGAGKTTLFRVLSGIVALDRGQISYDGQAFTRNRLGLRVDFLGVSHRLQKDVRQQLF